MKAAPSRLGALALAFAIGASAALGGPLSWPQSAQDAYDATLAGTWAQILPTLDAALFKAVKAQVGTTHGKLTIDKLDVASHDFSSPPRFAMTPIANGERFRVDLPKPGKTWSLTIAGRLTYDLDVKILFFKVKKKITEDVTLSVKDIRASEELDLDTTDPTLPKCTKTGPVKLDYDLSVKTGSTILNIVLFFARPFIDKLLRDQVDKALANIDASVAPLVGLPGPAWGTGAPAQPAFGSQPDLLKAALQADDDIQKHHLPWNTILAAFFTDPTYGQGTVTSYGGHGDSAIWSGHYLAGEAFRWAVTKDPIAQKNSARVLSGITDLLDAEKAGGGHLARVVIPLSDPSGQQMLASTPSAFATTLHGVPYVADDHISRDQYLGVMHGLGCAYDFLDDPAQKKLSGELIGRVVDYLVANRWVAMQHDGKTPSAPFVQSPDKMVAFTALAAHVDPARFQKVRDEVAPLVYTSWLGLWTSLLDPLNGYYKWNLGQGSTFHAMRLETDPARFMAQERAHAMEFKAIGHHGNAYFETVDAAVSPVLAPALAPRILDGLRRCVSRPRRYFTTQGSTDPSIVKDDYAVPLSYVKSPTGGTGSLTPVKKQMAKYPVPIEKRCATDFLWQRNPFQLDGGGDPREQPPGVDIVLPYWMARFYKLVP